MKINPLIRYLFAGVAIFGVAAPMQAQERDEARGYVTKFAIDPNFEKILKQRLANEQELGPLKDLIKKIAADPGKFPVDAAKLKDFKLDDPKFKKALQDWVASDPELRRSLEKWKNQIPPENQPKDVKQFQQELKTILDHKPKPAGSHKELPKSAPVEVKPKVDPLAQATKQAMEQAKDSKLGNWLNDSPAWKRAFQDLQGSINNPNGSRGKLGDWQEKVKLPEGAAWKLGEGTLDRLRDLPRPNLGRFSPSLPTMGGFRAPNLSGPTLPHLNTPSMPSLDASAAWILLIFLFLLFTWQMLRWTRKPTASLHLQTGLGPWPVRPEDVSTRAELVQAFDYLALLTLGLGVQCWNHQAVTRRWRESSPTCATSAHALALLYEQARYTEGAEALTLPEREQARHSLQQLAEAIG